VRLYCQAVLYEPLFSCYLTGMTNRFNQQFLELEAQLEEVRATKRTEHNPYSGSDFQVDRKLKLGWEVRAKHLLETVCGPDSQHFKMFQEASESSMYTTSWDLIERMSTVFLAAKKDFEEGYLSSVRAVVQAEVFDSELEQASELLSNRYKTASAVVAGTVLETALRELCDRNTTPRGNLNKMNADLAKQGVYNANMAKRITAIAGIRNSAAHGKPEEFTDGDVKSMIDDIERFLSQHLE
jgi:Domain of unknown function (DUF4145)